MRQPPKNGPVSLRSCATRPDPPPGGRRAAGRHVPRRPRQTHLRQVAGDGLERARLDRVGLGAEADGGRPAQEPGESPPRLEVRPLARPGEALEVIERAPILHRDGPQRPVELAAQAADLGVLGGLALLYFAAIDAVFEAGGGPRVRVPAGSELAAGGVSAGCDADGQLATEPALSHRQANGKGHINTSETTTASARASSTAAKSRSSPTTQPVITRQPHGFWLKPSLRPHGNKPWQPAWRS